MLFMESVVVISGDAREKMKVERATPAINLREKLSAYYELTKPRIALMILIVAAIGFFIASANGFDVKRFFNSMFGIALLSGGIAALNQYIERERDALMNRTRMRPIPAGKITALAALIFGLILTFSGLIYLAFFVNNLTALVGAATAFSYVVLYTLLKTKTTLATVIGAFPGAAPPLIGWAAARGTLSLEAWTLFAIMFLWQFPHFLAIAWMYREDYASAGIKMLPSVERSGDTSAHQTIVYALLLIPVSLLPVMLGLAGWLYGVGAFMLGAFYLWRSIGAYTETGVEAKRLLLASVLYLPALFGLMLLGW